LNFKEHIDYLRNKCFKALNLLKVVSKQDWRADRQVLLRLYRSLIRSKLDYGSPVNGSARKSYLRRLDTVQNQALRLCLGAFRTSPITSLHVEANETPMHLRRKKLAIQYALKIRSTPNNPVYDSIFNLRYKEQYERSPTKIPSFAVRIEDDLHQIGVDQNIIVSSGVPDIPPWLFPEVDLDVSLSETKKDPLNAPFLHNKFQGLKHKYKHYKAIYTDGSKNENSVGAGVVMGDMTQKIGLPKDASVFTAELTAIKKAFDLIYLSRKHRFIIYSDSLSALEAVANHLHSNPIVADILVKLHHLLNVNKSVVLAWVPSHIGIPGNERADRVAREALTVPVTETRVPYTDLGSQVRVHIKTSWQEMWDECENNKLHAIHPILGEWKGGNRDNRREERVLVRARIGHTYFTNGYLFRDEPMPQCIPCNEPLTVKHILIDCVDFSHIRPIYYNVRDIKELFETVNPSTIIDFIRDIGLLYRY